MDEGTVLELESVSKRFGPLVALDAISLRLGAGESLGVVGRNGAGKTTLIRVATGLLPADAGGVRLFGLDIERESLAIRRRLGAMPQDDALLEALTAPQYLDLVGRLHRLTRSEIDRRRGELFELLEIALEDGALISELSFGTRKKVALAGALLARPELLFLDEPFEGIDPIASRTIRSLLLDLRRKGIAVLLSSHQLREVERLCSRIAIVERGRLVAVGSLDELAKAYPESTDLESLFEALVGGAGTTGLSWL